MKKKLNILLNIKYKKIYILNHAIYYMNKQTMINSIKKNLSLFGKVDKKVLDTMNKIDRKNFIPKNLKQHAYEDHPLPIGQGQTISQPYTIARMLSLLDLNEKDYVLEIGTGSGYNAALIADLANKGKVLTLEIHDQLIKNAEANIKKLKLKNIKIKKQDFRELDEKFDKIIFTAGISLDQEKIIEDFAKTNLNENGILLCPFQSRPLIIIQKKQNQIIKKYTSEEYRFVPLIF